MISVIITAFREPLVGKAIESCLNQTTQEPYEVIVSAPDEETISIVKEFSKKDKRVKHFYDPGKGKALALKMIFNEIGSDILILTDGDVYISENSIESILKHLKDEKVGAVGGRPIATNPKTQKYGFYSHLLLDVGAHKIRKELDKKEKFLECSAYLLGIRNIVKDFPLDVAEDSVIPYLIWKQGYKIKYEPKAKVYVKYPSGLRDFVKQRKRAGVGSHSKLNQHYPDFPRVKTFKNEIMKGTLWALSYPSSLKELVWTLNLFPIRFYIWFSYYFDSIFRKKSYQDAWERIESTKT